MPKLVDRDQRRSELISALWRIVNAHGAQALSIRTVAAEAGVSKTNVAYYFPSRGHLLAAAIDQIVETARRKSSQYFEGEITVDGLVEVLLTIVPTTPVRRRQAEVWQLLIVEAPRERKLSGLLDDFNERVRAGLEYSLGALRDWGLMHPSRDLVDESIRLHALVDGLSIQVLSNPRRLRRERLRQVLTNHVHSLAAPSG